VASSKFDNEKTAYDKEVKYWNSRGGAPQEEFAKLESKRVSLSNMAAELNKEADRINKMSGEVNELLQKRNEAASEYNKVARNYNAKYGHGLEFNQAEYTGKEINVYQFTNNSDLRLALAHEFGHALTMDHTENPESIMYYETQEGGAGSLALTTEDLAELNRVCTK
jgi:predicted Zn-dependent protease